MDTQCSLQDSKPFPFLELPAEIRDIVYHHTLPSTPIRTKKLYPNISFKDDWGRILIVTSYPNHDFSSKDIYEASTTRDQSITNLLLGNRRIHDEASALRFKDCSIAIPVKVHPVYGLSTANWSRMVGGYAITSISFEKIYGTHCSSIQNLDLEIDCHLNMLFMSFCLGVLANDTCQERWREKMARYLDAVLDALEVFPTLRRVRVVPMEAVAEDCIHSWEVLPEYRLAYFSGCFERFSAKRPNVQLAVLQTEQ